MLAFLTFELEGLSYYYSRALNSMGFEYGHTGLHPLVLLVET